MTKSMLDLFIEAAVGSTERAGIFDHYKLSVNRLMLWRLGYHGIQAHFDGWCDG